MNAPEWFLKELEMIDPRYFVAWNEPYRYWEIKLRLKFDRKIEVEGGAVSDGTHHMLTEDQVIRYRVENPTIAIEPYLNDLALNNLRRRKYLRLKYKGDFDELNEIAENNRQAEEKAHQLGIELIAEGLMKMDKIGNKRSQVYDTSVSQGSPA